MSEAKTYSDVDILMDAISTINSVFIPVSIVNSTGVQLNRVSENLRSLLEAISQKNKQQKAEEPDVQLVDAGSVDSIEELEAN
jgi:hypothetical protein